MKELIMKKIRKTKKSAQAIGLAVLMLFLAVVPENTGMKVQAEGDTMKLSGYGVTLNGDPLTTESILKNGDSLKIYFDWTLEDDDRNTNVFEAKITPLESIVLMNCAETPLMSDDYPDPIGVYSIQNNTFKIVLDIESPFFLRNSRNGWANLDGKISINEDDYENGDPVTIKMFGKDVGQFTLDKESSTLSVAKAAKGNIVEDANGEFYQTYTVTLRANTDYVENIQLTDDMRNMLSQPEGMTAWTVVSNNSSVTLDASYDNLTALNAALATQTLDKNEEIVFEYQVKVDPSVYEQNPNYDLFKNNVTATYTNNKDVDDVKESGWISVNVSRPSLSKSATNYDATTGEVTWKIELSLNDLQDKSIENIIDTLGTGFVNAGSKSIPVSEFLANSTGNGKYTYTYTETVTNEVKNNITGVSVDNTIALDIRQDENTTFEYTAIGRYTVPADPDVLRKTCVGYDENTKLLTWDIVIDTGKLPSDLTHFALQERQSGANDGTEYAKVGNHEVSLAYEISVDGKVVWDGNAVTDEAKDVLYTTAWGVELPTCYHNLYIQLDAPYLLQKKLDGKDVTVTVQTKITDENIANMNYFNSVYAVFDDGSTPTVYGKWIADTTKESALSKVGTAGENRIDYAITVNTADMDALVAGTSIVLEDILPENMKYKQDSLKVTDVEWTNENAEWEYTTDDWWYGSTGTQPTTGNIIETAEGEQHKLIITIPVDEDVLTKKTYFENQNKEFHIRVRYTLIPEDAQEYLQAGTKEYTNTVTGTYEGESIGDATDTVELAPSKVVNKTLTYNTGTAPRVKYSIIINELAMNLAEGDTLSATDELGDKLSYKMETIKFYQMVDGQWKELEKSAYSYTRNLINNSMTFTFPDEMHLKLEYEAILLADNTAEITSSTDTSNTFSLSGMDTTVGEHSVNSIQAVLGTSVGANSTDSIKIWKYSGDDENAYALPGCKFALYNTEMDASGTIYQKTTRVDELPIYTVPDDGVLLITELIAGKVYALVEEESVEGYTKNEEPYYFILPEADTDKDFYEQNTNVDVYEGKGYAQPFKNELDAGKGSIEITKTVTGDLTWDVVKDSISFTITGPSNYISTVSGSELDSTTGKKIIENLEAGTYTVTENVTEIEGYQSTTTYQVDTNTAGTDKVATIVVLAKQNVEVSFTNHYEVEKTTVNVTKVWDDNNDQDGIRPDSITVKLLADTVDTGKIVVLSADNNWSDSFANLAKKSNGQDIVYTVEEVQVTDYTSVVSGSAATGYTITNSYTPETTSVSVKKVWNDNNDQDGIRPDDITVKLLADTVDTGKTVVLSAGNNWTGSFDNLAKKANGQDIAYTVGEVQVADYTSVVSGDATTGYTITNSYTPETTSVSVTKEWKDNNDQDGIRPDDITVKLLADTVETGDTVVLSTSNNWTGSFDNLAKKANGQDITYTVEEVQVTGYTSVISGDATTGYTITNSHTPERTSVSVTKVWNDNNDQDGNRPDSITVKLLADNVEIGDTVVLSTSNNWTGSFDNLAKKANGQDITYTVEEVQVTGYTSVISGDATTGYTITNSHTPERTSVSVTKAWNDNNDQDGNRPASVTVKLLADTVETGDTVVLSKSNNWTGSFDNLAKKANGQDIVYTVEEVPVKNYTSVVSGDATIGYTITNKYTPVVPTATPTVAPTVAPTATPTVAPTATPTVAPTVAPTATPTVAPMATPTVAPMATPTVAPMATPTVVPSSTPTAAPSSTPTVAPTSEPSSAPTAAPTSVPTNPPAPTSAPTQEPSKPSPTQEPVSPTTPTQTPRPVITVPDTGDNTPITLWKAFMLLGVSGMMFVSAIALRRSYKKMM